MSETETWGIVLRDRASGAEQWVACEVRRGRYCYVATAHGYKSVPKELALAAAESVGRIIAQNDRSLSFVRAVYPAQYAVRNTLAADEVKRLRNEVADYDVASLRLLNASNRVAVAYAESLARNDAAAFRRGAEAMRAVCADFCDTRAVDVGSNALQFAANAIRELPLPAEATPQPAQNHEATATPDAPLTIADAAARPHSAAAQMATCDHRWLATLDGLRFVCLRCPEVRQREEPAR